MESLSIAQLTTGNGLGFRGIQKCVQEPNFNQFSHFLVPTIIQYEGDM